MFSTIRAWFAVITGMSAPGMGSAPTTAFWRALWRIISSQTARRNGG
jgi:hypothetical protein